MSKVVNLRQARKLRDRTATKTAADANAARFGRSKVDKKRQETAEALTQRRLDGHKRDD